MNFKSFIAVGLACVTAACATTPELIVDPSSIRDQGKYAVDTQDCTALAEAYKGDTTGTAGKAAVGAGAGILAAAGVAAAVVATGGLVLLPGAVVATGVAAGVGGGVLGTSGDRKDLKRAREKIIAQCMNDRGYKAYSAN
jgi:hypothetical protein